MEMHQQELQLTSSEAAEAEAEESASLCERILADLEAIFRREEANILDFDIIGQADSTTNKSPVVYVDGHLALERWAVPHLYPFAWRKVLQARSSTSSSLSTSITTATSTTAINGMVNSSSSHDLTATSLHQCTRLLLLINPDLTTAWNLRREMLKQHQQQPNHFASVATEELRFSALVLARKPKCASAFNYREWLLNGLLRCITAQQHNNNNNNNSARPASSDQNQHQQQQNFEAAVSRLVASELAVTLDAASRYSRNYYAWSHRTWLLTSFLQTASRQLRLENQLIVSTIQHDLRVTTASWLEGHISDYSCLVHRQSLLQYLFALEQEKKNEHQRPNSQTTSASSSSASSFPTFFDLLQAEFTLLESLFPLYADSESLLLHRRALLKAAVGRWFRDDQSGKVNCLRVREAAFYRDHVAPLILKSSSSSQASASWQAELLRRYLAYLRRNLNWSFEAAAAEEEDAS